MNPQLPSRRRLPNPDFIEFFVRNKPSFPELPNWNDPLAVNLWMSAVSQKDWKRLKAGHIGWRTRRREKDEKVIAKAHEMLATGSIDDWLKWDSVPESIKVFLTLYQASHVVPVPPFEAIAEGLGLVEQQPIEFERRAIALCR